MDVYRKPRTAGWFDDSAQKVDSRKLSREAWSGKCAITFDATKDKSGERHTTMRMVLSENDVERLYAGLIQGRKNDIRELSKERDALQKTVDLLEEALCEISALAGYKRVFAPNSDEAFSAIKAIAGHFGSRWSRDEAFKHKFKWLKWKP